MPKNNDYSSLDTMRDMDEEDEGEGLDAARTYRFDISTSIAIRAGSLEEAEEILEEDDFESSRNVRILDQDITFAGEE